MDIMTKLKKRTGETDDELLEILLDDAKNAILTRRFPFSPWPTREITRTETKTDPETGEEITEQVTVSETYVEDCYTDLQYRIALDLYNKQGAEGQFVHSENGISRTYESSWISDQLLSEVIPYCGVAT